MTVAEALGQALLVTLAGTGAMVLGLCLYLGAKELKRRVVGDKSERQAQRDFERKTGLGL